MRRTVVGDARAAVRAVSRTFSMLAEQRRRYVLYTLQEASTNTVEFDEVATQVADWETHPDTESTDKHLKELKVSLHYTHLVKLEDHGIIDYDPRSEMIRYWDDLTKQAWLEQAKIEESKRKAQDKSLDEVAIVSILKPALKTAHDASIELERSFSCSTTPAYPDWDVTIAEVDRPSKDP